MVVMGVFSSSKSEAVIETLSKDRSLSLAGNLAEMVQLGMTEQMTIVKSIASNGDIAAAAENIKNSSNKDEAIGRINRDLAKTHKAIGDNYEHIIFVNSEGFIVADSVGGKTKGLDVRERADYRDCAAGKTSIGQVSKSKATGNIVTIVSVPITSDAGVFVGVLAAVVKIDDLSNMISASRGVLVAHPRREWLLEKNLSTEKGMESFMAKANAR